MKIQKHIKVPTGDIIVAEGEKSKNLEFLSIGDYGKDQNIKADFLGIKKEINGVPHGDIMPLEEKWVVTISSQYGCSMNCLFCDVPKVGPGINVTKQDLSDQVSQVLMLHPEVNQTKRLNIHYARMGEPTWNLDVLDHAVLVKDEINPYIKNSLVHPVISTMLPRNNKNLLGFIDVWCRIKNIDFEGDAGLQFSINSTDNKQREKMFSGNSLSIEDISIIGKILPNPVGRKYALNFALADEYIIDATKLKELFDPDKFMVKITPLHKTKSCNENRIETTQGYIEFTPYKEIEQDLKDVGFDVIVFVPSIEEDLGRITCGNAILSGTLPEVEYKVM